MIARRVLSWSLGWCAAAALYLLLIDTTDLPELIVGAVAAALAATGLELARERGVVRQRPGARWLLRAHRPLLRVPADAAYVAAAAVAGLLHPGRRIGSFRTIRFASGDEQRDSDRIALAESFGSFAPNTIVVGVDVERQVLLAHQLRRTGGRESLDPLELG